MTKEEKALRQIVETLWNYPDTRNMLREFVLGEIEDDPEPESEPEEQEEEAMSSEAFFYRLSDRLAEIVPEGSPLSQEKAVQIEKAIDGDYEVLKNALTVLESNANEKQIAHPAGFLLAIINKSTPDSLERQAYAIKNGDKSNPVKEAENRSRELINKASGRRRRVSIADKLREAEEAA